jgi:hemolysin III
MDVTPHAAGRAAEMANAITHGVGIALSLLALVLLTVSAAMHGGTRLVVGSTLFGTTLVLLYTMSTLYHAVRSPQAKRILHILDHSAIYLLIAGTYTPFCLSALGGGWGWSLFGVVWGLALAGVGFKLFFTGRFQFLSTAIYLAMSWMVMIAARPLWRALPRGGMAWLLAGGFCYTVGVVFYSWHRMKFHHAVWHLFVLGGSLCHVVAVLAFVIPRSTWP